MAIKQEVNSPLVLTVGITSALLLLVIVFGTEAWFVREENGEIQGKWDAIAKLPTPSQAIREAQEAKFLDKMDTAKQLVIQNGGKLPATRPAR